MNISPINHISITVLYKGMNIYVHCAKTQVVSVINFGALQRNNMSNEKFSEIYFLSGRILYVSFTFYAETQIVSVSSCLIFGAC